MPTQTYNTITKSFHWTTALLILAIIPLGVIANGLPYDTNAELAQKAYLFSIHKTLGVTVFFVAVLRILWAVTQSKPGPLHPDRKAETLLAEIIHWLLYISLITAPLSGWIHHAATTGFAPIWWPFGQGLPLVPKDEGIAELFASLHWVLTKVMAASVFLHVAGALKHQFVDKDATLRRMWFGKGDVPQTTPHRTPLTAPAAAVLVTIAATLGGAYMAMTQTHDGPAAVDLAQVSSDWQVDDGTLSISIKQFGNDVTGTFDTWTADITFDPNAGPDYGDVAVNVAIGSLTLGSVTDQAMGADFFDVAQFPTALFTGPITATDTGYVVDGELTVKGITQPIALAFNLTENADGSYAMQGNAALERLTFNVGQSLPDETNLGFAVGIDVALTATKAAP